MGKILQAFPGRHGHPVRILERDDWPAPAEIRGGRIVVVSVPMRDDRGDPSSWGRLLTPTRCSAT